MFNWLRKQFQRDQFDWTGEFYSVGDEAAFVAERIGNEQRKLKLTIIITAIIYFLGVLNDLHFLDNTGLMLIHIGIHSLAFIGAIIAYLFARGERIPHLLVMIYIQLLAFGETGELMIAELRNLDELPFIALIVIVYFMFPTRFRYMISGAGIASFTYIAVALLFASPSIDQVLGMFFTFAASTLLGATFAHRYNRAKRNEFFAVQHEKTLNEMLVMEINGRKEVQKQLKHLASTDFLTQTMNRRSFMAELEREQNRFSRNGTPFSVITFDVDLFKRINDTLGHDAGDKALRHLTSIIKDSLRTLDVFARLGGEEFAIIAPGANVAESTLMAERIRELVEFSPFTWEEEEHYVTVSLGVATISAENPDDLGNIINLADRAMYKAKQDGRNRVVVHRIKK